MCYEELNEQVEYLDLSHRNMGMEGVLDILLDLADDKIIKQVNLSYNIPFEEFEDPKNIEYFIGKMKKYLARNTTLTAIDLAGNFLFYHHPHPSNDHKKNYEKELASALKDTKISHIDLSENNIAGFKGRELDGFLFFMKNFMIKKKAFQVRRSNLTSQGFQSLVHTLGVKSSLTYLDVSDNMGGLDPLGRSSSEGIQVFARALSQTPFLRVLKIARNFLRDVDAEHISNAIVFMPGFQDLDISGNLLKHYSCRTVQKAICSHSITSYNPNDKNRVIGGFRELNISGNSVGDAGLREICFALERTKVLLRLRMEYCNFTDVGAVQLIRVLQENSVLQEVSTIGNEISLEVDLAIQAEVETNRLLLALKKDHMAVNCHALSFETYNALLRKLRYLDDATLLNLHQNASFTVPNADMTDALYLLSPPPRKQMIQEVVKGSDSLVKRIEQSKLISRRVEAEVRVGQRVISWWRDLKKRKKMAVLLNLTTKAVKINQELTKLYDRSQESVPDDGSSVASEGSYLEMQQGENEQQEGLLLVSAEGENDKEEKDGGKQERGRKSTGVEQQGADENQQKVVMMMMSDLAVGGDALEQGSASSVPDTRDG